jgi:hypothetical protein
MMTTSYDYDAPINEYGFLNQPKAELLGKLNAILLKYEQALLHSSKPRYYKISNACVRFIGFPDNHRQLDISAIWKLPFISWIMRIQKIHVNWTF